AQNLLVAALLLARPSVRTVSRQWSDRLVAAAALLVPFGLHAPGDAVTSFSAALEVAGLLLALLATATLGRHVGLPARGGRARTLDDHGGQGSRSHRPRRCLPLRGDQADTHGGHPEDAEPCDPAFVSRRGCGECPHDDGVSEDSAHDEQSQPCSLDM